MRYGIYGLIVTILVVTPPGWAIAQQPQESQYSRPAITPFESADTAGSDRNTLIEGRFTLRKGVSENNLDSMYAARGTFERALTDTVLSTWGHYYVGLADYRIANVLLAQDKKREADASEHLKRAVEHLQIAKRAVDDREETNEIAAEVCALLSNVYGRQISLSPIKGIFLGPKAKSVLRKAEQLAPGNPRVVLSSAISYLMTPRLVGGNKTKAMAGFRRATKLFAREKPADPIHPVWGHSETYIWMGIAHLERNEREAAREAFARTLEIDPDNRWAREMLSGDLAR